MLMLSEKKVAIALLVIMIISTVALPVLASEGGVMRDDVDTDELLSTISNFIGTIINQILPLIGVLLLALGGLFLAFGSEAGKQKVIYSMIGIAVITLAPRIVWYIIGEIAA